MSRFILSTLMLYGAAAGAVPGPTETLDSLRRCHGMTDAVRRLACYDELAAATQDTRLSAGAEGAAAETPARAASAARALVSGGLSDATFGLNSHPGDRKALMSTIPGRFDGWLPTTRFRLENGQIWVVVDGSSAAYWLENPRVSVVRGAMGAFYLEVEGTSISVRVRRLQ